MNLDAFLMVSTTTLGKDRERIRHSKGDRCRKMSTVREGGRGRTVSGPRRIAPTIPSFPSLSLVPLPCILNILLFMGLEWQMSEGRAKIREKKGGGNVEGGRRRRLAMHRDKRSPFGVRSRRTWARGGLDSAMRFWRRGRRSAC